LFVTHLPDFDVCDDDDDQHVFRKAGFGETPIVRFGIQIAIE
jgi:hypothetical protein